MIQACQRDAYARSGRSTVLRVERTDAGFEALLDDSVLYAEGGGQPADRGTVGGVPVVDVRKAEGGVLHVLAGPVEPGEVAVEVDWARRYDHMQQHTAQHLLTAVAQDRFGAATTSFHLHEGPDAACDIELAVDALDVEALEAAVAAEIRAARPVRARLVEHGDLAGLGVRTRGLPEGFAGPVRLVEIEGTDLNTCGGTHLASTAEIQQVALLGTERIRGGLRLAFVAGDRVLRRLRAADRALAEAGALLSRGPLEVPEGVRRLLDDAKAASKTRDAALSELADALGAALASGSGVRALHREDADPAFLNRVASAVLKVDPEAVVWLTASPDAFLLAGPRAVVDAAKPKVLELLGARGGGPPGRLQGKATRLDRRDEVLGLLRST